MEELVVIPARGGSKGIPNKNIKLLNNKPLIYYTVKVARSLFNDNQIIVSTDSNKIRDYVQSLGLRVPFLRPEKLATDSATTEDVLKHSLDYFEKKYEKVERLILLQPTSPLRASRHIEEAMHLYKSDFDMVVSVKETASNPYYVLFEESKEGYLKKSKPGKFTRRQDCPKVWEFNGAVYIINANSLKNKGMCGFGKVVKYEMDRESSIDIDSYEDWYLAELYLKRLKNS